MSALMRKDLAQARPLLDKALERRPRDAEMRHDLAGGLLHAGDIGRALVLLSQALAIRPNQRVSAEMLSAQLKHVSPKEVGAITARGLVAALGFRDVDPQPLARTAISWLVQAGAKDGGLAEFLDIGRRDTWTAAARVFLERLDAQGRSNALLWRALTRGINTDLEVERLLTAVRRHLLLDSGTLDLSGRSMEPCLLALLAQVHNNEHVWPVSGRETEALAALDLSRAAIEAGDASALRDLALRGLYGPFNKMEVFAQGSDGLAAVRPAALADLVRAVVEDRRDEREIGAAIPSLGPIRDPVSAEVAAQYEDNPYPRWHDLKPPRPGALRAHMADYVPPASLGFFEQPFDILVAGCGTGREAIQTALGGAPHGRVLALDLSRASLAYGARAAQRHGALNLEFARADILSWPDPGRCFRVIVCSGVLHHLGDPLAGWRALLRVLHPDGSMRIGLYSRLARQDVAWVREMVGSARPRTPAALRAARARLIKEHWADLGAQFRTSTDFFSSSGCRDLFFHEQEHQFTIPEIRVALDDLGLAFHGFVLPRLIQESFQRWAPPDTSVTDLNAWWDFEQVHPRSFSGMYQFWCRRRA